MIKLEKLIERLEYILNKDDEEINHEDEWELGWLAGKHHIQEYLTTILELYYNEQDK